MDADVVTTTPAEGVQAARTGPRPAPARWRAVDGRLVLAGGRMTRGFAVIAQWSSDEADRAALWAPVAIGVGVVAYFNLRTEPPAALFLYPFLALTAAWFMLRARRAPRWFTLSIAAGSLMALGALAADVRTSIVAAPRIERETKTVAVEGRLVILEEELGRRRLTIAVESIEGFAPEATPARVRISWRGKAFSAAPGQRVAMRARLSPPPPPVAPYAFDFSRHLFFERIGGVGFAVSEPSVVERPDTDPSFTDLLRMQVERARVGLARRIRDAASGPGGGIVAALVTGKRGGIDEASEQALRDSGLAHLLAISGLHMGLAAGIVFFGVRFGLAAIPPVALTFPIKKWAAAAALASSVAYLVISGSGWSARRAFVMTGVLLIAVLFDQRAFSLRNVALAATLILLTTPEAALHPGFQMSFAAATALIAAFSAARRWWETPDDPGLFATIRRYVIGAAATDTVAGAATAPFELYYFHRAAVYSLLGNLAATPIMGFWIMPAAVAGLLATPIGLDQIFWRIAAAGVDVVLVVAHWTSGLEGAVAVSPQWPPSALGIVSLGGLWLCFAARPWRVAGAAAIVGGFAWAAVTPPADLLNGADGTNLAIRVDGEDGKPFLAVAQPRRDRFAQGVWMELSGFDPLAESPGAMRRLADCDALGCVAVPAAKVAAGVRVAVSESFESLADDCRMADLVVALFPVDPADIAACGAPVVDRSAVWREGAHAVRFTPNGPVITSVATASGQRPWRTP